MQVQDLQPVREEDYDEDQAQDGNESEDKGDQEDDEGEDILENMEK